MPVTPSKVEVEVFVMSFEVEARPEIESDVEVAFVMLEFVP